uniref:Uncharacterized protein n=1 Tax=Triatoma infestans TaxID=30076 RepID=A0A170XQV2_TRIIF
MGRAFAVPMPTEHQDQASICPFALREVSVLAELTLGHLRYFLTDVPPQSNSPPGSVLESDHAREYVAEQYNRIHQCTRNKTYQLRRGISTSHTRQGVRPTVDNPWRLAREYRHAEVVSPRRTPSASPSK